MKKLLPVYLLLILATLSCSLVDRAVGKVPAPVEDTKEAVQLPTDKSSQPESDQAEILFQDDFSDTNSGWDRMSDDSYTTSDYQDGQYVIHIISDQYNGWANPGQYFEGDVRVEVDAAKMGGPENNEFGVICRSQDASNFYFFLISSDGYAGIGKALAGEWTLLSGEQMESVDGILPGEATNAVRADCIGNSLSLYANGQLIAEATDDSFTGGDVGLIAGSYDEGDVRIGFDNFIVRQP